LTHRPLLQKITAFILRPGLDGPQILAFQHPSAGLQLPAGTVEPGEAPDAAALREAGEETGLTRLRLVANLGTETARAPEGQAWLLRSLRPLDQPHPRAAEAAQIIARAWPVTIDDLQEGYAHVVYTERDLNHTPPAFEWSVSGWVPTADLATGQLRHFYHLEACAPTDPGWQQRGDRGHLFQFAWLPLDPPPALIPPQDGWLRFLPPNPAPVELLFELGDLALRKLQPHPADYAALQRWLSDPRVLEFYEGRDQAFDLARVMRDFDPAAAAAEGETPCLIFHKGWAAGYLQFYPLRSVADYAEYGLPNTANVWAMDLFLGQPELWGRGLGTQLLKTFSAWLFASTPAAALVVDPHADNARAVRAYEKAGFRKVKLLPAHELHESKMVDCLLMEKEAVSG